MRNPLIGLLIGVTAFSLGVLIQTPFQTNQIRIVEETKPVQTIDLKKDYVPQNKVVERNEDKFVEEKIVEKQFSIIEGDYFSTENNQLSMYLYSFTSFADEDEKSAIGGDIRIGSKIYEIDSVNQNRFASANAEFKTHKIKGVWYKFKGKLSKKGYIDGETVLSGKLQKFIEGKMVSEIRSQYIFYYHKCSQ